MNMLYLMQAKLDPVRLARWSAEQGISDPDRALHCLVYGTFGAGKIPRPFLMQTPEADPLGTASLLAYTPLEQKELRALAAENQTLAMESVMPPESLRTAPTPAMWKPGTKLGFSVRVRPTQRAKWKKTGKPTERDIYLERAGETTRGELYCQWVAGMMEKQGGALLAPGTLAMTRFAIRRVRRQRASGYFRGPDATISGGLEVENTEKFQELLAKGIGRHRAYGYGMVVLRPLD